MKFDQSTALRARAHDLIPGGAHTYAKGDDQYPVDAPGFIARGAGCHVWDVDGNRFIEYGMGLRAVTLGHGHPRIVAAAQRALQLGTNFVRPAAIEVSAAETLLSLFAEGQMAKFAKNGSDATTAAVRLARAYTGRDLVAVCADHPFFSTDDWFIGTTPLDRGIPEAVKRLTRTFRYHDLDSLRAVLEGGEVACVVMEAAGAEEPKDGYLHDVHRMCREAGTLLVLDEMITGFRWHLGGAQTVYGITPDLSTFGKGMANGFSVAALVGRPEIMELGGLRHDQDRVFLLSTTHGAETHALAAAIETIAVYQELDVVAQLERQGRRLRQGIEEHAARLGIAEHFQVLGRSSNLVYATLDQHGERSQALRTLFLQETIRRGLLLPSLVVSHAHTDGDIDQTVIAVGEALNVYRQALEDGIDAHLVGRPVQPVWRRRS